MRNFLTPFYRLTFLSFTLKRVWPPPPTASPPLNISTHTPSLLKDTITASLALLQSFFPTSCHVIAFSVYILTQGPLFALSNVHHQFYQCHLYIYSILVYFGLKCFLDSTSPVLLYTSAGVGLQSSHIFFLNDGSENIFARRSVHPICGTKRHYREGVQLLTFD